MNPVKQEQNSIRRVLMLRPNLESVPEFELPAGFSIRRYEPGDQQAWYRIHLLAEHHEPVTPALFARRFGGDAALLRQRQLYLVSPAGQLIGTASAWQGEHPCVPGRIIGRVHYVAIIPECQGRGLAKPLMSAVLRRLKELGHDCAYLATATVRMAAIKLYVRFGFEPVVLGPSDEAAWNEMRSRLDG